MHLFQHIDHTFRPSLKILLIFKLQTESIYHKRKQLLNVAPYGKINRDTNFKPYSRLDKIVNFVNRVLESSLLLLYNCESDPQYFCRNCRFNYVKIIVLFCCLRFKYNKQYNLFLCSLL